MPPAKSHTMNVDYAGRQPARVSRLFSTVRLPDSEQFCGTDNRQTDPTTIEISWREVTPAHAQFSSCSQFRGHLPSVRFRQQLQQQQRQQHRSLSAHSSDGGSFSPWRIPFSDMSSSYLPLLKRKELLTLFLILTPPLTLTLN